MALIRGNCAETRVTPNRAFLSRVAAVALAALASLCAAPEAYARDPVSYIVVEADTGHILRSSRSQRLRHPASLTKMMTLYLTFEALEARRLRPNQKLTASRAVERAPASELGLKRGDRITVRDAVRAAAVASANDAAVALAEAIGGSEAAFARKMTLKARELGMMDTTFRNATGLTQKGHLSTAHDLAILARRLNADFPDYYHLFSKRKIRAHGTTRRTTNRLLGVAPGVDGIKTGYTSRAGYNLVASARRDGKRVIVAFLSGKDSRSRFRDVSWLLDDGFKRLKDNEVKGLLAATQTAPRPNWRPAKEPERGEIRAIAAAARHDSAGVMRGSVLQGWAVQVGAFLDPVLARKHLKKVLALNPPGLASGFRKMLTARLAPDPDRRAVTVHRVRFTGLTEANARKACEHLKTKRMDCALVPPVGWGGNQLARN